MSFSQYSPTDKPAGAAIELNGITKSFGATAALRDITAQFAAGRMIALLGDNGAGKSTLLRIMAGLLQPTRGEVRVLASSNLREITQHIGYMPHAPLLYDDMSGMENLRYFAALYGIRDDSASADAIRLVGLDPDLSRRVGQYSQGMRQRMSLARAVVHHPKVLLLDEPFSNVDVPSARHMVSVLAQMRDAGTTIVVITHQAALLQGVADDFAVMSAGRFTARFESLPDTVGTAQFAPVGEFKARQN